MDLRDYRRQIDEVDTQLLSLFVRRMELSSEIAEYKKKNGLPVMDESREAEKREAIAARVPEEIRNEADDLYSLLFQLSRRYQTRLMEGK